MFALGLGQTPGYQGRHPLVCPYGGFERVGAHLGVCPGFGADAQVTRADTQVCPYTGAIAY